MDIPPLGPGSSTSSFPSASSDQREDRPSIEAFGHYARVEVARMDRGRALDPPLQELQADLDQLRDTCLPLAESSSGSSSSDGDKDALWDQSDAQIREAVDKHQQFGLSHSSFASWRRHNMESTREERLLRFDFLRGQVLNFATNYRAFTNEFNAYIQENRAAMVADFCPAEHRGMPSEGWEMNCCAIVNEPHRRGRVPVEVTLSQGEASFKVVVKPRHAELDRAVLGLFWELNQVAQPSINANLPTYQIRHYGDSSFSVWEYIDKMPASNPVSAENPIDRRLEQVARAIDLSDLHPDNVRFSHQNGVMMAVPIDLESRQPQGTGFMDPDAEIESLNKVEREVVRRANLDQYTHRFVPIPTGDFEGGLSSYAVIPTLAKGVFDHLLDHGYQDVVGVNRLESLIFSDLANGDIPFFEKEGNTVYYCLSDRREPIGGQ